MRSRMGGTRLSGSGPCGETIRMRCHSDVMSFADDAGHFVERRLHLGAAIHWFSTLYEISSGAYMGIRGESKENCNFAKDEKKKRPGVTKTG